MNEFQKCGLIEMLKHNTFVQILKFSYNNKLWTKDLLSLK